MRQEAESSHTSGRHPGVTQDGTTIEGTSGTTSGSTYTRDTSRDSTSEQSSGSSQNWASSDARGNYRNPTDSDVTMGSESSTTSDAETSYVPQSNVTVNSTLEGAWVAGTNTSSRMGQSGSLIQDLHVFTCVGLFFILLLFLSDV